MSCGVWIPQPTSLLCEYRGLVATGGRLSFNQMNAFVAFTDGPDAHEIWASNDRRNGPSSVSGASPAIDRDPMR